MTISFSQPLAVPEEYTEIKDSEVAFFRSTQSRTETYLTEDGYVDFEIRPALDLQIAPAPDSEPEALQFDWDIVEYKESYVVIQLKFENPEVLSSLDGKSMDEV